MFCSKCGTETPDDSQFCRKCGLTLGTVATHGGAAAAFAPARIPQPQKRKLVRTPFLVVGVLVLAFFVAFLVVELGSQPYTQSFNNPALVVNRNSFYTIKFDVPAGATRVIMKGSFAASGGSGNDVEVFVMPQDDFVNWANGHPSKSYYNSGKATVGTINVSLPSNVGNMILVLNNRFSLISQKTVKVNASLTYYK